MSPTAKMKAMVHDRYGDASVLRSAEIARPEPSRNQVLVKVAYASVNPVDWKTREGYNKLVMPASFPVVLGHDLAGVVEKIGANITDIKVGDSIFAMQGLGKGAYAQYATVNRNNLSLVPENMTLEEAASIPLASLTALQAMRDRAGIKEGMQVLINGASGGTGLYATQLALHFKTTVTATCSERNRELVSSMGATHIIDYTKEDITASSSRFDIIYDCVGSLNFTKAAGILTDKGVYVSNHTRPADLVIALVRNIFSDKKDKQVLAIPNKKDMNYLKQIIESGDLKAVIDRTFDLGDLAEAHRYSESGRARGKICLDAGKIT